MKRVNVWMLTLKPKMWFLSMWTLKCVEGDLLVPDSVSCMIIHNMHLIQSPKGQNINCLRPSATRPAADASVDDKEIYALSIPSVFMSGHMLEDMSSLRYNLWYIC